MPGPEAFANVIAGLQRLDGQLTEARNIWALHQRCGHNQCATSRQAIAALDEALDLRLKLMAVRDLEMVWIESGGTKELAI